ncbi:hypothetical protein PCURB6_01330 [Paenibacillus curdlanolyticus]|nr:hypothetical protein PCURB6_01330 [Paenibacillus curdlanolyticus]
MGHNNEILCKRTIESSNFVLPAFVGTGIGALLGLVAYVKDWI